ncbi:MAG: Veg protein [Clostridiaceae bacterium]|nr:Veg protein [Clostridiaceae bacterium]
MAEKSDLIQIKKSIEACIGERVQLRSNKGRKKFCITEGIIENTYPSIFTIRFENEYDTMRRVSYSYTDVLTNVVELVICKNNQKIQVS